MTKYKDIIGTDIQVVTTDPTEVTGQVLYNSDEGELKTRNQFIGNSWSTGGNMNTARDYLASSGQGTQTSTIAFGGSTPSVTAVTESWNGSSWTEVNDLNTARQMLAGAGTATSALGFGGTTGSLTGVTESWNGSSWTEVNDLNT